MGEGEGDIVWEESVVVEQISVCFFSSKLSGQLSMCPLLLPILPKIIKKPNSKFIRTLKCIRITRKLVKLN